MKLIEVIISNFRGYSDEMRIPISDLTALIGKNDVGKSTILEALDIFFNQGKIELADINVNHPQDEVVIGCVFDEIPDAITLENVPTSFENEYLLNPDGKLEIWKKYFPNKKATIWINAQHPNNDGYNDLLSKNNSELKTKIRSLGLEETVNLTINTVMRRALWDSLGDGITFELQLINADNADEKRLWPKVEPLLPIYRLFKADRPSTDEDDEAQDPMQQAVKIALQEQSTELARIADRVKEKVSDVAFRTIDKLSEFDPGLAATLSPEFRKEPSWEKAFSFSLTGDNSIPINKRGSGIRRLVLFSFFRATTESDLYAGKNIIYAVEEPETSQHPDAQKKIVETFKEMTEQQGCQIIITTHVPGLAGYIPISSLRYITSTDGHINVSSGEDNEGLINRIADALGVFPDFAPASEPHTGVKLIICVEGPNDIAFLTAISRIAHQADDGIIDLEQENSVVIIPLGGSVLRDWVNKNYLQKLNTREYHIYDSDNMDKYARERDRVNQRTDGSSARQTRKREMENYIHDSIIQNLFNVQIEVTDTMDVSTEISTLIRATNPTGYSPETVKKKLNRFGAQMMTMELLRIRDPEDEVLGWLREISAIVHSQD